MKIYFVRHGQTEYNYIGRMQGGKVDSPLTEKGIQQARTAGIMLKDTVFDRVYSSDLQRAMDTAKYIIDENKRNELVPVPEKGFRELYFGTWEGRYVEKIKEEKEFVHLRTSPQLYNPAAHGGESYPELIERAEKALFNIIEENSGAENLLVTSHGITITTLVRSLAGVPLENLRKGGIVENASISTIKVFQKEIEVLDFNIH
ncbi:histidine phosphatase family protein [Vagococcus elongatus]|nr:histidine phosphatase family protein [Vagococcus elongatus]